MKLLKALVIAILAVSLVMGIALPALASSSGVIPQSATASFKSNDQNEKGNQGRVQVITGNVTAINGNIITVKGKEITTDNSTRYKIPGDKDASLTDIQVGMHVVVQTRANDGNLIARQIVVVPKRPIYVQHSGNVTAYAYDTAAGGNITILDKTGKSISFAIIAGKFKVLPKGAEVKIGEMVTVTGHRDPAQDRLIATAVVVHPTPLQQTSGVITNINEITTDNGTITIGTTVLRFDKNTVLVIRGAIGARVGQQATATYREQADHTLLAKRIWIGINPAQPRPAEQLRPKAGAKGRPNST